MSKTRTPRKQKKKLHKQYLLILKRYQVVIDDFIESTINGKTDF
jgi:hypothetical protein